MSVYKNKEKKIREYLYLHTLERKLLVSIKWENTNGEKVNRFDSIKIQT